MTSTQGL